MRRCAKLFILALAGALALSHPGAEAQMRMRGTAKAGRLLYHSPSAGKNGLSCIHCHADFDEKKYGDGKIRAAHPLINSASRQTWWGQDPEEEGIHQDVSHAAVVCVVDFMQNPDKLTAQQLLDLEAYLQAITRQPIRAPLALAPGADRTGQQGLGGGDRIRGRDFFFSACHSCHPNGNEGIAPALPRDKEPAFYARKVREGNGLGAKLSGIDPDAYEPASGQFMPFFGLDRLSNPQLRDIIAYVRSLPPP